MDTPTLQKAPYTLNQLSESVAELEGILEDDDTRLETEYLSQLLQEVQHSRTTPYDAEPKDIVAIVFGGINWPPGNRRINEFYLTRRGQDEYSDPENKEGFRRLFEKLGYLGADPLDLREALFKGDVQKEKIQVQVRIQNAVYYVNLSGYRKSIAVLMFVDNPHYTPRERDRDEEASRRR
ncbi:MAG: hypothetical protein Q8N99_06000 [Nanoarchaeota archaeon]|nr:hypothetical protein [Nanoarchaeota archaeon]